MTRSQPGASARGVAAQVAPASSSGCAREAVRFHTRTAWPQASSRRTIAEPIFPVPARPICMCVSVGATRGGVRLGEGRSPLIIG